MARFVCLLWGEPRNKKKRTSHDAVLSDMAVAHLRGDGGYALSPRVYLFFARACLGLSTAECRSAPRDELSSKSGSERACPCHFRRNFLPGQHMPRASFSDAFVARFSHAVLLGLRRRPAGSARLLCAFATRHGRGNSPLRTRLLLCAFMRALTLRRTDTDGAFLNAWFVSVSFQCPDETVRFSPLHTAPWQQVSQQL